MNTKYTIKNFRVFDENGVTIDLRPLTILTGCNSSGKSSIVKSLLLLCEYFSSLKTDKANGKKIELTAHELDFTKKPHNLLGKFSKVVHKNSDNNTIIFEMQVHSLMLTQDMNIELVFAIDENSFNGLLNSITIKKLDDTILYSSKESADSEGNPGNFLPEFYRFIYTLYYTRTYQAVTDNKQVDIAGIAMSDEDLYKFKYDFNKYIDEFKKNHGEHILLDINKWNNACCTNILSFDGFLKSFDKYLNDDKFFKPILETGLLYYLPVIGEKLNGSKTECINFLTQCIKHEQINTATASVLRKIIDDFKNSSADDFISYYKMWEKLYLSEYHITNFFNQEKKPSLFHSQNHVLKASNIMFAPHNYKCAFTIGNNITQKTKKEEIAEWEAHRLTFADLFEVLAILSSKVVPEETVYFRTPHDNFMPYYTCTMEKLFFEFIETAIEEIVVEATPEALSYVSSSIINIKRLYPMEAQDEFTGLLKRYMKAKRLLDKSSNYVADTFLNKWIETFGIGKFISINLDKEGLGITLRLHENENDEEGSLLADSGYGITQLFAILLNVEIAIMERKNRKVMPDNQIVDLLNQKQWVTDFSISTLAIEEPEIHLHPNYQSRLADMFVEAYREYNIHFMVETHSEYLIRKLQVLVAKKDEKSELQISNDEISIIYVNSPKDVAEKGEPQVKQIEICNDGYLDDTFGEGFFDEATKWSKKLIF